MIQVDIGPNLKEIFIKQLAIINDFHEVHKDNTEMDRHTLFTLSELNKMLMHLIELEIETHK